jgi:hypothetical protein
MNRPLRRAEPAENFSRNVATSYLQLDVNVVYSLVSIPLILHWLPKAEFGMWLLPQIAKSFYIVWYFIACCMGIVIGNVRFTPLGLCLHLRQEKAISKGFNKPRKSCWRDAEKPVDLKRHYRQIQAIHFYGKRQAQ